jgi:hypothetical protein
MIYELWDLRSNNLINSYESEDDVRALLRDAVALDGDLAVEWLMVVEDDPNSEYFRRIGIGSELLAYIRDAA